MRRIEAHRGGATLLLFGLVLAPTIFMLVIWHLLAKQNEIVNAERARQASGIAEFVLSSRNATVFDYAVWDDLYQRLVVENDLAWFATGVGWGMGSRTQRNATLLLDPEGQPLAGSLHDRKVAWSPHKRFGPDFATFFADVREDPHRRARSVFMASGGQIAAVSLAEIRPYNPEYFPTDPRARRFLLFAEFVDGDTVAALQRTVSWRDLTLTHFPRSGPRQAIRGYSGATVGYIGWDEPRFGRRALVALLPTLGAVLAVTGATIFGHYVRHRRNAARLIAAERRAHALAHCDALTGAANRRALLAETERLLAACGELQAVMIDFDGFKEVNDRLGHKLGDALLLEMTQRMQKLVPDGGILARIGGDEFAVLVPMSEAAAAETAHDLLMAISAPFYGGDLPISISASFGLASAEPGMAGDELLRRADLAMYEAKKLRPGLVRHYRPALDQERRLERQIEAEMRDGLARGEFWVAYQPIHSDRSGGLVGVEALARWSHPERGEIGPGTFIPIAERSRLILELGAFVLREACTRLGRDPRGIRLSVNLSPAQLLHERLVEQVAAILVETGFPPERLELEITEGYLIEQPERAAEVLGRLRDLGVRISLDDFGSGYASVGYLRLFPLDKIKIDRSFVQPISGNAEAQRLVAAIVSLCHALDKDVVAEGVETEEQAAFLRGVGCDGFQGYLFGRPARELPARIEPRGARTA